MTLKTGLMMLKMQLCITGVNYILNQIKSLFIVTSSQHMSRCVQYIKIENKNTILLFFFCIFDPINTALMSRRDFFKKHKNSY